MRQAMIIPWTLAAGAILLVLATSAHGEEAACTKFAWSLDTEKAWFAQGPEAIANGAKISTLFNGAWTVTLAPADKVAFTLPPERNPEAGMSYGAVIAIGNVAAPGRYQVTLSDEAWIDLIQDGAHAPSAEHSGVKGCPGLRFDLKSGPMVLQLSGAPRASLSLAISSVR